MKAACKKRKSNIRRISEKRCGTCSRGCKPEGMKRAEPSVRRNQPNSMAIPFNSFYLEERPQREVPPWRIEKTLPHFCGGVYSQIRSRQHKKSTCSKHCGSPASLFKMPEHIPAPEAKPKQIRRRKFACTDREPRSPPPAIVAALRAHLFEQLLHAVTVRESCIGHVERARCRRNVGLAPPACLPRPLHRRPQGRAPELLEIRAVVHRLKSRQRIARVTSLVDHVLAALPHLVVDASALSKLNSWRLLKLIKIK